MAFAFLQCSSGRLHVLACTQRAFKAHSTSMCHIKKGVLVHAERPRLILSSSRWLSAAHTHKPQQWLVTRSPMVLEQKHTGTAVFLDQEGVFCLALIAKARSAVGSGNSPFSQFQTACPAEASRSGLRHGDQALQPVQAHGCADGVV